MLSMFYSFLLFLLAFFPTHQNINKQTILILTGDVMLGRSVTKQSLLKQDPHYPFLKVADKLKSADIVFSNLETSLVTNCPITDSGLKFCADPKMIDGLKFAGIDVVNLANNHTSNYGKEGLKETEDILTKNDIKWVDGGNLEIIENNGTRFGFLGFDFVGKEPKDADYQLVRESKKKVDVLIPMVHWGVEYTNLPTSDQKLIAENLITSGADIVVGGHSHWVQNVDYVNNKPIFYSLGNFVFDQPWSEETKHGLAVELTFTNKVLSKTEKMPIYMRNFAQPEWFIK